jgi:hypothetical protein
MPSQSLNHLVIRLAMQKKNIVIKLRGKQAFCTLPEIQGFFSVVGVKHFDGHFYFPKDGIKFLEALFDYYFLKLYGLVYPHRT